MSDGNLKGPKYLPFAKMHGLGNDFVMVQDVDLFKCFADPGGTGFDKAFLTDPAARLSELAVKLCDRRFGIGADGLIVALRTRAHGDFSRSAQLAALVAVLEVAPSYSYLRTELPFSWIYINSDGSSSQMCGNGLRCLALFMRSLGWSAANDGGVSGGDLAVATSAYPVALRFCQADSAGGSSGGAPNRISVTMAGPSFNCSEIPCSEIPCSEIPCAEIPGDENHGAEVSGAHTGKFIAGKIILDGIELKATAVGMGNPHCVIFDDPLLNLGRYADSMRGICGGNSAGFLARFPAPLLELAGQIQAHPLFPQGVNVEFVLPLSPNRVQVFVVERGCGPTLACGSGAMAVVAAGVIEGRLKHQCCVILPGGELEVCWSEKDNCMELIGPAQFVYSGQTLLDLQGISSAASDNSAPTGKTLGAVV